NQAYHVWGMVNTVAQGNLFGAIWADDAHECFEKGTIQDSRLSFVGIYLGHLIESEQLEPSQLADWVEQWFGTNGWDTFVQFHGFEYWDEHQNNRDCPGISHES